MTTSISSAAQLPAGSNRQQLPALPESLRGPLTEAWENYTLACRDAGLAVPSHPDFTTSMLRAWAGSEFVMQACIRDPELLHGLLADGTLLGDYAPGEYRCRLDAALRREPDASGLGRVLREFRRREMLRIAWRDLAGWAPLAEVLADLSDLADACIGGALDFLGPLVARQCGIDPKRFTPQLVVLGMGKLGARELNFSSDIDLIFAYPETEADWKPRDISPDEFYLQLARQLIAALDAQTAEGFVFRVDMRLRPYGDSGPLVASFDALTDYYQLQGREWERYAMIKARPVAGPAQVCADLMELLRPFVYRRYLDFGAFESLRGLKQQIIAEVERRGMQQNVKLGSGGIREIEFIVQAFQLVRGGREQRLQQRSVLVILEVLAQMNLLPARVAVQLAEAYVFLRRAENRLQEFADRQTHELPDDEDGRARLAFAMGYPDYAAFLAQLEAHRALVAEHFAQVFAEPDRRGGAQQPDQLRELADVWGGVAAPAQAARILSAAGFADGGEALDWLRQFRSGPVTRFLGEQGRQRLDELMPRVLAAAGGGSDPLALLKRMGALLEAVAGRTTYLSLLVENPVALAQLAQLCAASSWLATELAHHPILLDELLDPRALYEPLDRAGLQGVLQLRLAGVPPDDLEQQMDRLRQFRQAAVLHVAAADIVAGLPVTRVADDLTDIAEVVLQEVLALAWRRMTARYGVPGYVLKKRRYEAGFAIVAYGKLGGREMGYGSDLDVVFLHDSCGEEQYTGGPDVLDNNTFFTRLSQRVIHMLNTYTAAGVLYEVDMRLRPNGNSGLLVSSMEAFAEYQRRSAWTWENQALIRARVVAGSADIARQFERIRSGVLARPRDPDRLRAEVLEMRTRMRAELDRAEAGQFDLKQGRGGIVDIEFMVQFLVLRGASEHDELLRYPWTIGLLEACGRIGLLPEEDVAALTGAYRALRGRINHQVLREQPALLPDDELVGQRTAVRRIWERVMGEQA